MDDNPYQAPLFTDLPTIGVDDGNRVVAASPSEAEIRAFVGKKADYYLRKWHPALYDSRRAVGFNWAAFLVLLFWLPYRKMYRLTLILFGIIAAEAVFDLIVIAVGFVNEQRLNGLSSALGFAFSIFCGANANAWYFSHTKREIARIRALGLPDDAYFDALARRGGTNRLFALGLFPLFLLAFVVIVAVAESRFIGE